MSIPPPPLLLPPLDPELVEVIRAVARGSVIADYEWDDRGSAPIAYTEGMALGFVDMIRRYLLGDTTGRDAAMAAVEGSEDTDALAFYADAFAEWEMDNSRDGLPTLRHLFVLMLGLGMRESSGIYCCGRDQSADNVAAETAEAGLFQMSWNMESCSSEMQKLMTEYETYPSPECLLEVFCIGVGCDDGDWENYGSGDGAKYQNMAKRCPLFAVETCAIGLRHRRQHWGPINRFEVEVRPEADQMFADVQRVFIDSIDAMMA